jgi:hypothetical protein
VLAGVQPNLKDLDVYLGVLKAFETAERRGTLLVYDLVEAIEISGNELCDYCSITRGGSGHKRLIDTILLFHRLSLERHTFIAPDETEKKKNYYWRMKSYIVRRRNFRLLQAPDIVENKRGCESKIRIEISKEVRHWVREHRMLVHWRDLQQMGQLEKGVFLYLECNKPQWVRLKWLMQFLGMKTPPKKPGKLAEPKDWEAYRAAMAEYMPYLYQRTHEIRDVLAKLSKKKLIRPFDTKKHKIERHGEILFLVKKMPKKGDVETAEANEKRAWLETESKKAARPKKVQVPTPVEEFSSANWDDVPF